MNAPADPQALARELHALYPDRVYEELDFDTYRAIERLSYSGAKKLVLQSAAHYIAERAHPRPSTAAMQLGTAFHTLLLEPHLFDRQTIVLPDEAPDRPSSRSANAKKPSPATVEALAWWRDFDARAAGRIVLSAEDRARLDAMVEAVQAHPGAMRLLAEGQREVSMLWTDARFGVSCKGRVDWLRPDGGMVDIKTTVDASPLGFARTAANFLYHLQAAAYFSGAEHLRHRTPPYWAWLVVEPDPPYGVATYVCEPDALLAGAADWDTALGRYAAAMESGQWECYPPTIEPLRFPSWALRARNPF